MRFVVENRVFDTEKDNVQVEWNDLGLKGGWKVADVPDDKPFVIEMLFKPVKRNYWILSTFKQYDPETKEYPWDSKIMSDDDVRSWLKKRGETAFISSGSHF